MHLGSGELPLTPRGLSGLSLRMEAVLFWTISCKGRSAARTDEGVAVKIAHTGLTRAVDSPVSIGNVVFKRAFGTVRALRESVAEFSGGISRDDTKGEERNCGAIGW